MGRQTYRDHKCLGWTVMMFQMAKCGQEVYIDLLGGEQCSAFAGWCFCKID